MLKSIPTRNVREYGARGDGHTDDAPAFRQCAAALESDSGGVLYVPSGTYRLSSCDFTYEITKDEVCTFNIGGRTEIRCEEATLWLDASTLRNLEPFRRGALRFSCIGVKRGAQRAAVVGAHFTTNGWVLDVPFRPLYALAVMGDDFRIINCNFHNWPGRNPLIVGWTNTKWPAFLSTPHGGVIEGCSFRNGSRNVYGNNLATDCAFLYIVGSGIRVRDCTFKNDAAAITNCSGVEFHSSNCSISGCKFENLWPAMYVGWEGGTGAVAAGNRISDSRFTGCVGAIHLADSVNGLTIQDDVFEDCSLKPHWAVMSTRDNATGVTEGEKRDVSIVGCKFRVTTREARSAIRIAGLKNAEINNNEFVGISNPIEIPLASNHDANTIIIAHNISRHPVLAPKEATGLVYLSGVDRKKRWSGSYRNIGIESCNLFADPGTSKTALIVAAGDPETTSYQEIWARNNVIQNATDGVVGPLAAALTYAPLRP
jgi:hypothetical protein